MSQEPQAKRRRQNNLDKKDDEEAVAQDGISNAAMIEKRTTRGRAKKAANTKSTEQTNEETTVNSNKISQDVSTKTDAAGKRKRGGGKSTSSGTTDATATTNGGESSESAPKKRRGRPKKTNIDGNTDQTDDGVADASRSGGRKEKEKHGEPVVKTVTIKGVAPVDSFCSIKDSAHVFVNGNEIYDVMLNQTNVQNNNNKYYLIQLLEDDSTKSYSVWQRWGRVGYDGQNKLDRYAADLDAAKNAFYKKFNDKTGNHWTERSSFVKRSGKYDLVEIDYAAKEEKEEESTNKKTKDEPPPPSKLPPSIQDLLNLICDIRAMETAVREMQYDASKAPLGKLTTGQITAGYAALKNIEACVEQENFDKELTEACNEFYTRIPHYFGMKTPPLIRSMEEIKQKIQLLETLSDIEVAMRTLAAADEESARLNPMDKHYEGMKCSLTPLDQTSDEFQLVDEYLTNTHAPTHTMYKMELLDAYRCSKDGEDDKFNDVGNRMLLWHGSRLTNWYGILSQGLRIAPPEAPVTGYMFGKGVYFADMSSKSANYCFTTREKNTGLLVLCEVALGNTRELLNADYNANKLPAEFHSTKGIGRTVPDEAGFKKTDDGCVVPCGKPMNSAKQNATLQYNEYIVYDTKQIRMKYLLKVKFAYH